MIDNQQAIMARIDNNVQQLALQPPEDPYFSRALQLDIMNNLGEDIHNVNWLDRFDNDVRENHRYSPNNANLLATHYMDRCLTREHIGGYCGAEATTLRRGTLRDRRHRPRPPIPNNLIVRLKSNTHLKNLRYNLIR
jgi:hypothetical protein